MGDILILRYNTPTSGLDALENAHSRIIEQMKTGVVVLPYSLEVVGVIRSKNDD